MTQSRILTVIPVFNRGAMAIQALLTVLAQTRLPDLICVVNDGSTDGTPELLTRFAEEHPDARIVIEDLPNRGAARARNYALDKYGPSFDMLVFLDSDDLWPVDFLARTSKALLDNPSAVAASTSRIIREVDKGLSRQHSLAGMQTNPWLWIMQHGGGIASCTLFRTDTIRSVGLFPTEYITGHDVKLFGDIANKGPWLHVEGQPVTFRTSFQKTYPQAAPHINQTVPDKYHMWARAHEALYKSAPLHVRISPRFRRKLCRRWRLAALERTDDGHTGTWDCIRKGLRVYPFDFKLLGIALSLFLRHPIESLQHS